MKKFKDNILFFAILASSLISVGTLIVIVGYIFIQGIGEIDLEFLTNDYESTTLYVEMKSDGDLGFELEESSKGVYQISDITNKSIVKSATDRKGNPVSIKKGDYIISINKESLDGMEKSDVNKLISSIDGEALLKIKKEGGGIVPMFVTTIVIILFSLLVSVPIGIFSAIYLTEYAKQGKFVRMIRFSVECLAGIPSIIYGLFGMLFFVVMLNFNYSIISGALTVSIVLLPIIIRTTEESLKTVPISYREASLGLGATKIQTIRKVILPSALPGILTAVILSIGRIIGESAALLLTAGTAAKIPDGLFSSGSTLTVKAYLIAKEEGDIAKACAFGIVIIIIILLLNLLTKFIARRRYV